MNKSIVGSVLIALAGAGCCNEQIFYCSFDSEAKTRCPEIGPEADNVQIISLVKGKSATALSLPLNKFSLSYPLQCDALGTAGRVEFWARLDNPTRPITNHGSPRLFLIHSTHSDMEFCLEWNANNGVGGGGLTLRTPWGTVASGRVGKNNYDTLIKQDIGGWHKYTVDWDAKGICTNCENGKSTQVYARVCIDDSVALELKRKTPPTGSFFSQPSQLLFPTEVKKSPWYHVAPYSIDDFSIWCHSK